MYVASHAHQTVIAFQIVLCLIVGCVGISIVWCAILGFLLMKCWRTRARTRTRKCGCDVLAIGIAVGMDVISICYYAYAEPPITTVAHVLAILLGTTLEMITRYCINWRVRGERSGGDASTPLVRGSVE